MQWFLIGLLVFAGVMYGLRKLTTTDVRILARQMRRTGGIVALGLAVVLGLTGRIALAVPVGAFGMMLLGRSFKFGAPGFFGGQSKSPGQRSRVRAARVEMTLDHDSGDMDGVVIGGAEDGRRLSDMTVDELAALWGDFQNQDMNSAQLLEAYLDRARPGWRQGRENAAGGQRAATSGSGLSREEAFEILGLAPGASAAEIHGAHRALMKKLHPDTGGSTYLAAKVNQAKELLL